MIDDAARPPARRPDLVFSTDDLYSKNKTYVIILDLRLAIDLLLPT